MIIWLLFSIRAFAADASAMIDDDHAAVLRRALAVTPTGLTLPDAPATYHLRYTLTRIQQLDARASFGSLIAENLRPQSSLSVEFRLGDPQFDNLGFGGWQNGVASTRLAEQLTPHALDVALWRLSDGAYKEGVEQYARKRAQVPDRPDHPGDYTLTGAVVAANSGAVAEPEGLAALATRLSAGWLGGPVLDRGEVYVGHEAGARRVLDTEGTDVAVPIHETSLRAAAHLRADDGAILTEQVLWTSRSPADLPPEAAMLSDVRAARDRLAAIAAAPVFDEEYVGPVLFEGEAAGDLFRYLLPEQLEGTPADIPFDTWFGDLGGQSDPVRVGRRVLPPGWGVVSDPRRPEVHPGAMTHDAEGTPAERVELVEDGIVRTLAMSRTPRKGVARSNGHAWSSGSQRGVAQVTMMEITPDRRVSAAKLRQRALKEAKAYGRDHVLVIQRLQVPAVRGLAQGSGFVMLGGSEDGPALPPPVAIIRLYADGREELLRGAAFASVERFVLRDLVAAGPQSTSNAMSPRYGTWADLGPVEGMASWTSAPSVLVGELELVPAGGDPRDKPVLPPPPVLTAK
jgi:hypothetical protein